MAYGLNTYFADGTASFEMSDQVVQLLQYVTPAPNSSGSIIIPGVVSVAGLRALPITYESIANGGQKFNTTLIEPNILQWSPKPYSGFLQPSSGIILVVNRHV